MSNPFTLEILQAINDWQRSTTSARGKKLEELCSNLPINFRTANFPCYRKINLEKGGVFSMFAHYCLPERISSWSSSVNIVQSFKRGVSLKVVEQSFIYRTIPAQGEVILNLTEVYKSPEFNSALDVHRRNITDFRLGIGRYGNTQYEVVLKKDMVTDKDIYMLGGRSSAFCASHAPVIYKLSTTHMAYDITTNSVVAFKWLNPKQTQRVIARVMRKYPQPFNVYGKCYGFTYSKTKRKKRKP